MSCMETSENGQQNLTRNCAIGYLLLHLFLLFWSVSLALKTPQKTRVMNVTLAIVFAPAYVLAHYISKM